MDSATRIRKRWANLKDERSTWDSHHRELAEYILPRHIRINTSETNKGSKRNDKIFNGTATRSLRVLASGMMAGITSPARRWYRLTTPDPNNVDSPGVRDWLEDTEKRMFTVFARSNLYNVLAMLYEDIGCFATSPILIEEDDDDIVRAHNIPVGSYVLVTDDNGRVSGLIREISMTAEQIEGRFGLDTASDGVKQSIRQGRLDDRFDVLHAILPNDEMVIGEIGPGGMDWASLWIETRTKDNMFLGRSGYYEFPVMAPRWDVTGNDVYGTGPGMDALGDVKALQELERRKLQAMSKIVNPPMKGPASLRAGRPSILAGDMTYVDATAGGSQFEPAHLVDPRVLMINEVVAEHERRISSAFYADLFLVMTQRSYAKTAREVDELHEEKMLQLGPVLERLQDELLDPMIDRVFGIMYRNGMLMPPPDVLDGADLRVEYISILSQAQKMLGTISIERIIQFVSAASDRVPEILDKIDWDQTVDELSDLLGVPISIVLSDAKVEERRKEREAARAAEAAAQQAPALNQMAQAAKNAKEAGVELGNAEGAADMIRKTTGVEP